MFHHLKNGFVLLIALLASPLIDGREPSHFPSMTVSTKKPTQVTDVVDKTLLISPSVVPSESFKDSPSFSPSKLSASEPSNFPSCFPSMLPVKSFKSSKKSVTTKSLKTKTSSTRRLQMSSKGLSKGSLKSCGSRKGKGSLPSTKAPSNSRKGTTAHAYSHSMSSSFSTAVPPKSNGVKQTWCMITVTVISMITFNFLN